MLKVDMFRPCAVYICGLQARSRSRKQGTRLSLLCWDPSRPPTKKPQVDFICYLTGSMTRQCHRGRKDVPALALNLGQVDLKHCHSYLRSAQPDTLGNRALGWVRSHRTASTPCRAQRHSQTSQVSWDPSWQSGLGDVPCNCMGLASSF